MIIKPSKNSGKTLRCAAPLIQKRKSFNYCVSALCHYGRIFYILSKIYKELLTLKSWNSWIKCFVQVVKVKWLLFWFAELAEQFQVHNLYKTRKSAKNQSSNYGSVAYSFYIYRKDASSSMPQVISTSRLVAPQKRSKV